MKIKDLIDERLEISYRELAEQINVSRYTIMNIVSGKSKKPQRVTVKKICKYFGVNFRDYLD